ncbi:MAG: 6-phosphogluconolactonase [Halioglobus sp.]|nr:6-phosphogluconolactonase [Halioglobus sp.]
MKRLQHPNQSALCLTFARDFVACCREFHRRQPRVRVALPGGRSITGFLAALQIALRDNPLPPSCLDIFLCDERLDCSPRELNETLLHDALGVECNTYFLLRENVATYNRLFSQGNCLDIVILGVGEDGHVASIFPHDTRPLVSKDHYLVIDDAPKPPARRITLSKHAILESSVVFLLFLGEHKRRALQQFLDPRIGSMDCPARLVLDKGHRVTLVTDLDF